MAWDKKIATVVAVFGTIGIKLLGGWDGVIYALCMVMMLDYISGVACAIKCRKLSSSMGIDGIIKKVMILCMVALAVVVDDVTGATGAVRLLVILFYIGMEGVSILENMVRYGVDVPDKLRELLVQLHAGEKKYEPVITQTVNQEVVSTTNGITTETSRETITSTVQKEE